MSAPSRKLDWLSPVQSDRCVQTCCRAQECCLAAGIGFPRVGEQTQQIIPADDGAYEVLGAVEIGKIERLFGMEIATDDFTTIAGFVIAQKGSVPNQGERLSFHGLDVEVLDADERRISRLRLKRTAAAEGQKVAEGR